MSNGFWMVREVGGARCPHCTHAHRLRIRTKFGFSTTMQRGTLGDIATESLYAFAGWLESRCGYAEV